MSFQTVFGAVGGSAGGAVSRLDKSFRCIYCGNNYHTLPPVSCFGCGAGKFYESSTVIDTNDALRKWATEAQKEHEDVGALSQQIREMAFQDKISTREKIAIGSVAGGLFGLMRRK